MIIKNALLPNGKSIDIEISQGIIKNIGDNITCEKEDEIFNIDRKYYISPGWIDIHTHAFPKYPPYFAEADDIGIHQGVTTIVDAGSAGSDDIDEFFHYSKGCKTDVFSLLNISKLGLKNLNELSNLENIDREAICNALSKYPSFIVGLKARISASVVGTNNLLPLEKALKYKEEFNLPLMVHIGSAPPRIEEILDILTEKCIITHSFNGKSNNLFGTDDSVSRLKFAIKRGMKLDLGHGSASFEFSIAKKAKKLGFEVDTISSDIYTINKEKGPVFSLANVMSKFLALDYSLDEIIRKVTENPAKLLNFNDRGKIEIGKKADFTIFELEEGDYTFMDSSRTSIPGKLFIKPKVVIKDGIVYKGD